jgi:hypothetical protein
VTDLFVVARRRRSCRATILLLELDELVGRLVIVPALIGVGLLSASNQPTGDPLDMVFDLNPIRAALGRHRSPLAWSDDGHSVGARSLAPWYSGTRGSPTRGGRRGVEPEAEPFISSFYEE